MDDNQSLTDLQREEVRRMIREELANRPGSRVRMATAECWGESTGEPGEVVCMGVTAKASPSSK